MLTILFTRFSRPTWSQFCEQNSPKIPFIPLNGRTYSFQIPTKGRYYFGIIDCRHAIEPYFRADLHYVLLNPDGSQLPLGQALLPYIESTFTGLWTLLLLGNATWDHLTYLSVFGIPCQRPRICNADSLHLVWRCSFSFDSLHY